MTKYGEVYIGKKKIRVKKEPLGFFSNAEIRGWGLCLNLSGKNISDITEIVGLDTLSDLLYLNLSKNKISSIKGIDRLQNLRILMINKNNLTSLNGLDQLHNLRILVANNNQIQIVEGLDQLSNLRELTLNGNPLTKISGLGSCSHLEFLGLKNTPLWDWGVQTFGKSKMHGCVNGHAVYEYFTKKTVSNQL